MKDCSRLSFFIVRQWIFVFVFLEGKALGNNNSRTKKATAFWAVIIDGHHAKCSPSIYFIFIVVLLSYALFPLYKWKTNKTN